MTRREILKLGAVAACPPWSVALTAAATLAYWNALPAERRVAPKAGLKSERESAVLQAWHPRT